MARALRVVIGRGVRAPQAITKRAERENRSLCFCVTSSRAALASLPTPSGAGGSPLPLAHLSSAFPSSSLTTCAASSVASTAARLYALALLPVRRHVCVTPCAAVRGALRWGALVRSFALLATLAVFRSNLNARLIKNDVLQHRGKLEVRGEVTRR